MLIGSPASPKRNAGGYLDMTAYYAIQHIERERRRQNKRDPRFERKRARCRKVRSGRER